MSQIHKEREAENKHTTLLNISIVEREAGGSQGHYASKCLNNKEKLKLADQRSQDNYFQFYEEASEDPEYQIMTVLTHKGLK